MTCCQDWDIIPDEKFLSDCLSAPDSLRGILSSCLSISEEGEFCFQLRPDGKCSLLDEAGLCLIQRSWGEEHLCDHCSCYPRFFEEYGCLTEYSLAVSCPEAARMVMEQGIFPLLETDDLVEDPPFSGVDLDFLSTLIDSRQTTFQLLTENPRPLWSRLADLLSYAGDIQDSIDFSLPFPEEVPSSGSSHSVFPFSALSLVSQLFNFFAGLDFLRPEWPDFLHSSRQMFSCLTPDQFQQLQAEYQAADPLWDTHLTRFASYFLFRHWPKTINDDLLYGRAALTVGACLILHFLSVTFWKRHSSISCSEKALIWAAFSREVEHQDENLDSAIEILSDESLWPLKEALSSSPG